MLALELRSSGEVATVRAGQRCPRKAKGSTGNESGLISLDDSLQIKYDLIIIAFAGYRVSLPSPPPSRTPIVDCPTLGSEMTSSKELTRRWQQADLGEDGGFSSGERQGPFWNEGRGRGGEVGSLLRGCRGKKASTANFASGPLPQHAFPGRKE